MTADVARWHWGLDCQVRREDDGYWRVYRWRIGGGWDVMGTPIPDTGQDVHAVLAAVLAGRQ